MSTVDARYRRYADMFEEAERTESIEVGWRALHWQALENSMGQSTASGIIRQHARQARGLDPFS